MKMKMILRLFIACTPDWTTASFCFDGIEMRYLEVAMLAVNRIIVESFERTKMTSAEASAQIQFICIASLPLLGAIGPPFVGGRKKAGP